MTKKNKGLFITFEGIDRCGKSTQAQRLASRLQDKKMDVVLFREPGSTVVSEQIRRILLSVENGDIDPRCELMLYSAARAQLVSEQLIPALDKGQIVIFDRFYHSTTAYQGYGRGLSIKTIESINKFVSQGIAPDISFLIDISPEEASLRYDEAGRDRLERSSMEFFKKVHEGYLEMVKKEENLYAVDGTKTIDEIAKEVWKKVSAILPYKIR